MEHIRVNYEHGGMPRTVQGPAAAVHSYLGGLDGGVQVGWTRTVPPDNVLAANTGQPLLRHDTYVLAATGAPLGAPVMPLPKMAFDRPHHRQQTAPVHNAAVDNNPLALPLPVMRFDPPQHENRQAAPVQNTADDDDDPLVLPLPKMW